MKKNQTCLTRRDFIRGSVGATLAASLATLPWKPENAHATSKSLVSVVRDQDVMNAALKVDVGKLKTMVDKTVLQVSGKSSVQEAWAVFVKPDDVVGLVPTPHLNPTHTELIEVVKNSLVEDAGVEETNIIDAQGGKRRPAKCSVLISTPALKAHWLTGIGTVIKNYIMYSGRPTRYHGEDSAKLGEIWQIPQVKGKTKLVIVDALHPLCDKGPQPDPRYKWAYNGLIAGIDPVAVETVCLKIITEKRNALRGEPWPISPPPICVEAADRVYGLGTSRLENISVAVKGWKEDLLLG
jgi:hypothetical protein